ncbi:AraC family transcriptional regulator [Actinomadura sp. ATCC 31491]|uniref:AraC family transcriptional regulator n=1 Tax=Actinomadura luzonensis TaxID=2805427 RepID=A0ABT0G1N6_9ACTN|nr:AraC family transcriptional regulator [Actinomadura luzonensis]MCK2218525.1 AraC family transcriptional regulator [Actinomadura luzonensis]
MREETVIAAGDGFAVRRVTMRATTPAWTDPDMSPGYHVVLVRAGVFRARVGGDVLLAEPATAYVGDPGRERSIAHAAGRRDAWTAISLAEEAMHELTGGARPAGAFPVTGRLAVRHRALVAGARRPADGFELAERTARLVGDLLREAPGGGPARAGGGAERPGGRAERPGGRAERAAGLVEGARELLALDPRDLGLREVARRVGCSPYHLSRVFHRETGMTLSRYRNRMRVLLALDAIEDGHRDLAGLAAELGFADHAHLTRTVRRECGHPPRELRRLLARD